MKSDKQTEFLFKRMRVTCPLFCFMLLACTGLSGCGILIPSITSNKVDLAEINENDLIKVVIDDSDVKYDETGRKLVENANDLFSKKFKHTSVDSSCQGKADECIYIKPLSVWKNTIVVAPYEAVVKSSIKVMYGQQSKVIDLEGSGKYSISLPEMAVWIGLGIGTLGLTTGGIKYVYGSIAHSLATAAVSSKLFNSTVDDPLFNQFVDSVKVAHSLPSDLSVTAKFFDSSGLFPNNILDAAEEGDIVVTITNKGKGPGYGTVLEIAADTSRISFDKSITVGDIPPGEKKEVRLRLQAGYDLSDGETSFAFSLKEKRGYDARKVIYPLRTARLLKPQLQIVDKEINDGDTGLAKGNGNGIPESGETVEVIAFIKNSGEGRAVGVTLKGSDLSPGIRWVKDEILVGAIPVGESVKAKLAFEIPRNYDSREIVAALTVSDVRGIGTGSGRLNLAYGKRIPELRYAWKVVTAKGQEVSSITNGSEYELELSLVNRGGMDARNVTLALSPGKGLDLDVNRIEVGDVKEQASTSGRRVRLSLPRTYTERQALVSLSIAQSDFPTITDTIAIPVEVKAPRLSYIAQILSKGGGNTIEQNETAILELRLINEGSLPAQGVRVSVASRDENLRIMSKALETLGTVKPGTAGEIVKFQLTATRRIKSGENRLSVEISQDDFPTTAIPYVLAIREEGADVIRVATGESDLSVMQKAAKRGGGPEITPKGVDQETSEETYRVAFEVADATRNIDDIKVSVNGVVIPLGADSGMGTVPQKRKQIMATIPLREGVNQVLITARNTDYASSSRELFVTRRAEEDVDTPPITGIRNPDAVAVVVGISRYEKLRQVDYARRDAETVKSYLVKTLGYDGGRIITLYDEGAGLDKMQSAFRTRIRSMVVPDKSDVFVYYSGHGVPDVNSKEPYLAPYGLDGDDIENTGYILKDLYQQLGKLRARSVTVVIDSCFSGSSENGEIIRDVSPVLLRMANPMFSVQNGALFTASSSTQVSSWYRDKKHGLFTYYFLQGLRGKADADKDGRVTVRELEEYVVKNVTAQAAKMNRRQTPEVMGDPNRVIVKFN